MIRLIKPYLDYTELEPQFAEIINSGYLTKGEYSKLLPKMLKDYLGVDHAYLTTSATTALTMSLKLLDIGHGDEVIVSDFSFPASANVIEDVGAKPVFVDVNLRTYNMLVNELEEKINPSTKAVIFVDAFGNPSGLLEIVDYCRSRQIPLIEDAACALGSSIDSHKVGTFSDITCFSFHPRKLLTCGEGGAITTNNQEYADKLAVKLNHGADENGDYLTYGYNYRMPELACCMGCSQLPHLDTITSNRRDQAEQYKTLLSPLGFQPQQADVGVYHNMQSVVFTVPEHVDRNALLQWLASNDIEATIGTYCLSNGTYFREKYGSVQPNALFLQNNTISLPCYAGVPIDIVVEKVIEFVL
jgi:dTDP-4-amino-4,6-dideoxygalactose transaminase